MAECRQRFVGDAGVNENALRLVNLEGTSERDAVEVATRTQTFFFTPWHNLQRFRHGSADPIPASQRQLGAERNGDSRLRTRCVEVTGNGQVFAGTWSDSNNQCASR